MTEQFDAIVIGTGQAGPPLADRLTREGLTVAVIERQHIGGTCVNVGCTPTKAMVASARAAHVARIGADFGVQIDGSIRVDMRAVKARKDTIVKQSNQGLTRWLEGMQGVTLVRGHARFAAPRRVRVGERVLAADRIFINTGARARIPDLPGIDTVAFLTSSTVLDLEQLPEHLLVVGGSYIGLEFAQMFRRFGARVTVLERGARLVAREDEDVSAAILEILEGEGIEVALGADCLAFRKDADRVVLTAGGHDHRGSHVLLGVGRRPNSDDLGLAAAGIETDERGYVVVDDQLRTSAEGVFALGDVNGKGAFTHTAYNDFEIVAANLFEGASRRVSDRHPAYALYIDPPLARVGLTERQARERGRPVLRGTMAMARVGRARERGETQGFMKILVDQEAGTILGASVLGIGGDEVIHGLLNVMYTGASFETIRHSVPIHPTVSELLPTLLGDLQPLA